MKSAAAVRSVPRAAGFSLLELLVAVAVFSVISTLLYGTLARTARSRQFAVEHEETAARARAVFTWLERDLSGSFGIGTYPSGNAVFSTSDLGQDASFGREAWLLDFTTLSARGTTAVDVARATEASPRDRGDQARVLYRLEADPETNADEDGRLLVRYELRPAISEIDLERATRAVIGKAIDAVELRFHDGRQWSERWDGANPPRPPRAVEVSLRIRAADGAVLSFVSAITIPLGLARHDTIS